VAISTPISRDIVVSEKRNYVLSYTFCDQNNVPSLSDIVAKAFPRFANNALFIGFLGYNSTTIANRMFSPGDRLWRRTGSKTGKFDPYSPQLEWPVATEILDVDALTLPFTISAGVLSVTIPFGASFSRLLSDTTGVMSTDDMYYANDPAKYIYAVTSKGVTLGSGYIDITIDLGKPIVTPDTPPTVCSVKAT
jgi:hypothetical protein